MKSLLLMMVFLLSFPAVAVIETNEFNSPEQEALYHRLIDEIRCLVCQNQNLAESDAELAVDLREKVYEMVTVDGASRADVLDFMVTRYGDFVLYKPPFKLSTALLWLGPGLLLLLGFFLLWRVLKRTQKQPDSLLDNVERSEIRKILESKD